MKSLCMAIGKVGQCFCGWQATNRDNKPLSVYVVREARGLSDMTLMCVAQDGRSARLSQYYARHATSAS